MCITIIIWFMVNALTTLLLSLFLKAKYEENKYICDYDAQHAPDVQVLALHSLMSASWAFKDTNCAVNGFKVIFNLFYPVEFKGRQRILYFGKNVADLRLLQWVSFLLRFGNPIWTGKLLPSFISPRYPQFRYACHKQSLPTLLDFTTGANNVQMDFHFSSNGFTFCLANTQWSYLRAHTYVS